MSKYSELTSSDYSYDKEYFEALINRNFIQFFLRKLFFIPLSSFLKGNVLDLGCGIGEAANFVSDASFYYGADINPYCVEHVKKIGLSAKLGSVYNIPYEDGSMDVILLSHVLEHLDDPDKAMRELSRVLKSNGKIIIIVPMIKGYLSDKSHRIFYYENNLVHLAAKHRYKVERIFKFPFPSELLGSLLYFFEYRMIISKNGDND